MFLVIVFSLSAATAALPCTDIQITAKDGAVLVGRSFEWEGILKENAVGISSIYSQFDWGLRAWPAGQKVVSRRPDGSPGASWTSRYTFFGFIGGKQDSENVSDGQNSEGLSLEMLNYPNYAEYQEVTPADANVISTNDFGNWILGNFASVDDVKRELPKMTVWGQPNPVMLNQIPQFHFAVHDKKGNSIIIEYTKKKLHVFENSAKVMTNSPDYGWMLENLRNYVNLAPDNVVRSFSVQQLKPFGQGSGMLGMPGDYTPPSRFVKAAYLVQYAKQPDTADEGVRAVIHIMNNVDIPFGSVRDKNADETYAQDYTQMKVIKNLTKGIWYIDTYLNVGSICRIDLNAIFANPEQYQKPVGIANILFPDVPDITGLLKN
jgi:penicillin V acylase-like amidase (Ntn superfamily)